MEFELTNRGTGAASTENVPMEATDKSLETIWTGWLRPDGRKGVRNLVLVVYTVECAKFVAHEIVRDEEDTQVIGFPGCYDNAYAIRLILALGRHPNVGAVLAVGLGCEYTQPGRIAEVVRESGRPAENFFIQDVGGTRAGIREGKAVVHRLRERIRSEVRRVPMTPADLLVGCECGGSDGTSGLAGNPVVGRFFDRLVDSGGTAVFEEVIEMIGLRDILLARAASPAAATALGETYDKALDYCRSVRQYSASPGNFAGGLSTIEEKSMGAFAKSGSRPIQGVIKVAERPPQPGLWLLDSVPDPHFMQFGYTNPNDTEGLMDLISAGAQIILFVTGRGSVIGSPIAPLIKITGNAQTYRRMEEDMDFDASPVLTGEATLDQRADALFREIVRVSSGAPSKPEALGHREYFIMYKHQDTPSLLQGCRAQGKIMTKTNDEHTLPFQLKGETALITGGGSGLGFAIAQCMARAGTSVVLVGRREAQLAEAAAKIGERAGYVAHDVTELDRAGELVERAEKAVGSPVSILVNNAGIHCKKTVEATTSEDFQSVLSTHVCAAHALSRAVVPGMRERGYGSILLTASMASLIGIPLVVAYSAAKSAYLGMARSMTAELAGDGVRVNAIAPGWIESPMLRKALDGDEARTHKILGRTPMGRFGEPDDIGWAAVYLASPAAKFVSGVCLPVDGGASVGF